MRILFLFLLFWGTSQAPLLAQETTKQKVLETELLRFQAMTQKDTQTLRNMLDTDLIYLHSNGHEESKQEHLKAIAAGTIIYQTMNRAPAPKVRVYGKMALVTGKVRVAGQFNENPFSILLLYSATYRRKKGNWRLLNWQSTRIDTE